MTYMDARYGSTHLLNSKGDFTTPQVAIHENHRSWQHEYKHLKKTYTGTPLDLLRRLSEERSNKFNAYQSVVILPGTHEYYEFNKANPQPARLNGVPLVDLVLSKNETDTNTKEKLKKILGKNEITSIQLYTVCPLIQRLDKNGDPLKILPLVDEVAKIGEQKVFNPSSGCVIT